jgi:protein-S-isoprenylcysteine O-methyltransferase Ste14
VEPLSKFEVICVTTFVRILEETRYLLQKFSAEFRYEKPQWNIGISGNCFQASGY